MHTLKKRDAHTNIFYKLHTNFKPPLLFNMQMTNIGTPNSFNQHYLQWWKLV